jgi:hypothetical protein
LYGAEKSTLWNAWNVWKYVQEKRGEGKLPRSCEN